MITLRWRRRMITIGVRTSHGQDWRQRIRPPYARSWTSSSPPKWQSTRAVAIWRGKCRRLTHSHSLSLYALGYIKFTTIAVCPRREREKKNELPIAQWSVTYSSSPVQSSWSSAIYSTVQLQSQLAAFRFSTCPLGRIVRAIYVATKDFLW